MADCLGTVEIRFPPEELAMIRREIEKARAELKTDRDRWRAIVAARWCWGEQAVSFTPVCDPADPCEPCQARAAIKAETTIENGEPDAA